MTEEPHGVLASAVPLPEARRIRRAIDSLDLPVPRRPPGAQHPMGERGEAAQLFGFLRGYAQQIQTGLSGGPLHEDVQKGLFGAYDRDMSTVLAGAQNDLADLSAFCHQGILALPLASQQMAVAAAALRCAAHALAAAAEIAVGPDSPEFDGPEVMRQSEEMYEAFDMLAGYVAAKRAEWAEDDAPAG